MKKPPTDKPGSTRQGYLDDIAFSPKMISQQIVNVLKQAIVNNDIKGGEKLSETYIEKQFGVSRSPVREAIRELEKIRLVEIHPRRGAFIRKISEKDIKEDLEVRGPLEGIAAREAFLRKDPATVARMEEAIEAMRECAAVDDRLEFWEAHRRFHEGFIMTSGHELLMYILPILRLHSERARNVYPIPEENLADLIEIHQKLLNLFKSADTTVDEIEAEVSGHITGYLYKYLEGVDRFQLDQEAAGRQQSV